MITQKKFGFRPSIVEKWHFSIKKILNLKYKNDPLPTSMGKCVKGILCSILHEFSYGIEKFSGTQLVLVLAGT